jgi:hypothetical protein
MPKKTTANDRITFRPGDLSAPLDKWCKANGATHSKAIRAALSLMLKVSPPSMPVGRPPVASPSGRSTSPTA